MPSIAASFQTFIQNLSQIYDPGEARSIARIVFEDALRIKNTDSFAQLSSTQHDILNSFQRRLLRHEPVQYILGQADFYGLKFKVSPAVLIPRQETEELIAWILETIKRDFDRKDLRVLDIGTGSGCIPITLKKKSSGLDVIALDISPKALEIAEENAEKNHAHVTLLQMNILDQNRWSSLEQFDIIVSNPPYIPLKETGLMPKHVTQFEPGLALFVGNENPLIFYENIADFAKTHLAEGGFLFFECNEFNAQKVVKMLENKGFKNIELQQDINGRDRMIRVKYM